MNGDLTDDRRERLKEALLQAEGLGAAELREYLGEVRQEDAALAGEVESLLGQRTRGELAGRGGLPSALEAAFLEADKPTAAGRCLGQYRLRELIGTGGMGAVYRASQEEPIHREVAVKLLRGGLDPVRMLARFEGERRALALVDHPGIARILDAGADEAGTPYIVMELVRGVPITEFCRGRRPREILDLFASVCRAVQHAHQKGIIHRDLKPSNVLVSEVDGKPIAKIIDFGIARVIEEDGRAHTLLTGEGQIVGTLEYMSPEQAAGRSREIDTRTDVYSLGAVLYELLTGTLPHDLSGKSLSEAIETKRHEPPRAFRQTGVERRPNSDLETITRKALEIEPARRYDGPGTLADDLERYLRSEPILARPASTTYQIRMLVRRHRTAVAVGGGVIFTLVIFGIAMSVLYAGQRRERERAEAESAKSAAVNRFLQELLASTDPAESGKEVTVRQVLDRSLGTLDGTFARQPDVLAALQTTLGSTYSGLGEYQRADSLLGLAHALNLRLHGERAPESIETLLLLASSAQQRAQFAACDSLARRAVELIEPGSTTSKQQLARAYALRGEVRVGTSPAEGESLTELAWRNARAAYPAKSAELAEYQHFLGNAMTMNGRPAEAEPVLRDAAQTLERTRGIKHPRTLQAWNAVAGTCKTLGRFDESRQILRRLLAVQSEWLGPDHPTVADIQNDLAVSLIQMQGYGEAESLQTAAIRTWIRAYGEYHVNVGAGYQNLAFIRYCRGDLERAEAGFRRAIAVMLRLVGPEDASMWNIHQNLASVLLDEGRLAEAMRLTRQNLSWRVRQSGAAGLGVSFAHCMGFLGFIHLAGGGFDSAQVWIGRSLAALDEMHMSDDPTLPAYRCALALALDGAGRRAEADSILREERGAVVASRAWPPDKRRILLQLERYYRSRGEPTEAAYYGEALHAMAR